MRSTLAVRLGCDATTPPVAAHHWSGGSSRIELLGSLRATGNQARWVEQHQFTYRRAPRG